jgi:hypothetical protein
MIDFVKSMRASKSHGETSKRRCDKTRGNQQKALSLEVFKTSSRKTAESTLPPTLCADKQSTVTAN